MKIRIINDLITDVMQKIFFQLNYVLIELELSLKLFNNSCRLNARNLER
jgi:hypothetical protein